MTLSRLKFCKLASNFGVEVSPNIVVPLIGGRKYLGEGTSEPVLGIAGIAPPAATLGNIAHSMVQAAGSQLLRTRKAWLAVG